MARAKSTDRRKPAARSQHKAGNASFDALAKEVYNEAVRCANLIYDAQGIIRMVAAKLDDDDAEHQNAWRVLQAADRLLSEAAADTDDISLIASNPPFKPAELPDRMEFRPHQREEFLQAIETLRVSPELKHFWLSVKEDGGETVAILHRGQS